MRHVMKHYHYSHNNEFIHWSGQRECAAFLGIKRNIVATINGVISPLSSQVFTFLSHFLLVRNKSQVLPHHEICDTDLTEQSTRSIQTVGVTHKGINAFNCSLPLCRDHTTIYTPCHWNSLIYSLFSEKELSMGSEMLHVF